MGAYGVEVDLIDAMAADLEAHATFAEGCRFVKYRRPRMILPEDCPLLCIVLAEEPGKITAPQTTVRFGSNVPIAIEYHLAAVEEVQTLIDDPELSLALIAGAKAIESRVRRWSIETASLGGVSLGVDACDELTPSLVVPFRLEDGFVEGIAVVVDCRVTESAGE